MITFSTGWDHVIVYVPQQIHVVLQTSESCNWNIPLFQFWCPHEECSKSFVRYPSVQCHACFWWVLIVQRWCNSWNYLRVHSDPGLIVFSQKYSETISVYVLWYAVSRVSQGCHEVYLLVYLLSRLKKCFVTMGQLNLTVWAHCASVSLTSSYPSAPCACSVQN